MRGKKFKHPDKSWWIRNSRGVKAYLGVGGKDLAVKSMKPGQFLVGFDVWWKTKDKPSKGFAIHDSAASFFNDFLVKIPARCRTFNQIIMPEQTCEVYFDLDVDGQGDYDLVSLIHSIFELICEKIDITVKDMWTNTVLLDASASHKSSCHGICKNIVFPNNHSSMKPFFAEIKEKLGEKGKYLDLSVYSKYRCFRMHRNSKIAQNRPLVVAKYNKCPVNNPLMTLVDQGKETTFEPEMTTVEKKRRRKTINKVYVHGDPLYDSLLKTLRDWGNPCPNISCIKLSEYGTSTYVSFSGAHIARDHQHRNNNMYAIVYPRTKCVTWKCHKTECKKQFSAKLK